MTVINQVSFFGIPWIVISVLLALALAYKIWDCARYRELAFTDRLTRATSRLGGEFILEQHERQRRRHRRFPLFYKWWPLFTGVIEIDVDHFKRFNDAHGHAAGDYVLALVADIIQACLRKQDKLIRPGGEEMRVILRGSGLYETLAVAERIRQAIANAEFYFEGTMLPSVTCTLGVSVSTHTQSLEDAIRQADRALYRGKEAGRNRVEPPSAKSPDDLEPPTV